MAIYEYRCENCGVVEAFQKMTDEPLTKCPKCGKCKVERLISVPSPPQFKTGGFYATDYKKKT